MAALARTRSDDACDPRALNPLRHAAYSRAPVLPGENADERRLLEDAYFGHFQPATQPEVDAVRELVDLNWRRARLAQAEAAMVAHAVSQAENQAPEHITALASEVRSMEVETGLLNKLLLQLQDELDRKDGEPRGFVVAASAVLDRLLLWKTSAADLAPEAVLEDGVRALHARIRSMEATRETLKMLVAALGTARDAARAEASLLDPRQAARLLQERTTLSRAIERQIRILRELRGGGEFEAHIRMTEAAARAFHETKPDRLAPPGAKEAVA